MLLRLKACLVLLTGFSARLRSLGQERDGLGHHLMLTSFLPVLRLPPTLLEPSINDHAIALAEILTAMLRLFAEHHDVDVAHLFLQIIALLEPAVDRHSKAGYRGSVRGVPLLGMCGQRAGQKHL